MKPRTAKSWLRQAQTKTAHSAWHQPMHDVLIVWYESDTGLYNIGHGHPDAKDVEAIRSNQPTKFALAQNLSEARALDFLMSHLAPICPHCQTRVIQNGPDDLWCVSCNRQGTYRDLEDH